MDEKIHLSALMQLAQGNLLDESATKKKEAKNNEEERKSSLAETRENGKGSESYRKENGNGAFKITFKYRPGEDDVKLNIGEEEEEQQKQQQQREKAEVSQETVTEELGNEDNDKEEVSSIIVEHESGSADPPSRDGSMFSEDALLCQLTSKKQQGERSKASSEGGAKVYCVCKQPYNEMRPMLACDICDEWFHYECVGLLPPGSEEEEDCEGMAPEEYHCESCCKKHLGRRYLQSADGEATGIVHDDCMLLHECTKDKYNTDRFAGHVEHPNRIRKALKRLRVRGIISRCKYIQPRVATDEELREVHSEKHIKAVMTGRVAEEKSEGVQMPISPGGPLNQSRLQDEEEREDIAGDPDIYFSKGTARAAKMAAGCAVEATLNVVESEVKNAFALVRPPGHHAEHECAMGFCFFNNCAVAASAALKKENVNRVMIIDWDVHHGNGISDAFYEDDRVLYLSMHRFGDDFFPGTGDVFEAGKGKGEGYTVNIPFEATGLGDVDYLAAMQLIIEPIGRQFKPDLVIIACGFDAARGDPLGEMCLSPAGFYHLTARVAAHIQPRMSIVLEGGYNHSNVAKCSEAVVSALLGDPVPLVKAGLEDHVNPKTVKALKGVIKVQCKYWDCFDTAAHKICLTGRLRVSDLQLAKKTKLLKNYARERSQMLQYGCNEPRGLPPVSKFKRASGSKSKKEKGYNQVQDKISNLIMKCTADNNRSSKHKRKRKGPLTLKVPSSKTGITQRTILPKPSNGKGGEAQSPDSFESALSPLQQRKILKLVTATEQDRSYLAAEFTTTLLGLLKKVVHGNGHVDDNDNGGSPKPQVAPQSTMNSVRDPSQPTLIKQERPAQVSTAKVHSGKVPIPRNPSQFHSLINKEGLVGIPTASTAAQSTPLLATRAISSVSQALPSVSTQMLHSVATPALPLGTAKPVSPTSLVFKPQHHSPLDLSSLLLSRNLVSQQAQSRLGQAQDISPSTLLSLGSQMPQALQTSQNQFQLNSSNADALSKTLFLQQAASLLQQQQAPSATVVSPQPSLSLGASSAALQSLLPNLQKLNALSNIQSAVPLQASTLVQPVLPIQQTMQTSSLGGIQSALPVLNTSTIQTGDPQAQNLPASQLSGLNILQLQQLATQLAARGNLKLQ